MKTLFKIQKRVAILLVLVTAMVLSSSTYRARAEQAWQILMNGKVSSLEITPTDSGQVVAVHFRVPEEGESATYGVRLESDGDSKQVKIIKVKKKGPVQERGDCPQCAGSEKCQDCYTPGSGENTAGTACYSCDGTGDCAFCSGSGDCYSCGGDGFPEPGCNTCGDVSS